MFIHTVSGHGTLVSDSFFDVGCYSWPLQMNQYGVWDGDQALLCTLTTETGKLRWSMENILNTLSDSLQMFWCVVFTEGSRLQYWNPVVLILQLNFYSLILTWAFEQSWALVFQYAYLIIWSRIVRCPTLQEYSSFLFHVVCWNYSNNHNNQQLWRRGTIHIKRTCLSFSK